MAEEESQRKQKEEALVSLYEERYGKVVQYVFVRVGNRSDAEDLASETFMRALKSLDSYEERGLPMEAWIFRIAHNLVTDHIRRASKRQIVDIDETLIVGSANPEEATEIDMQIARLSEALKHLSPSHREVIALRFYSGLSSVECGKILGRKPGAIREMQSAAVKILRKEMKVS